MRGEAEFNTLQSDMRIDVADKPDREKVKLKQFKGDCENPRILRQHIVMRDYLLNKENGNTDF